MPLLVEVYASLNEYGRANAAAVMIDLGAAVRPAIPMLVDLGQALAVIWRAPGATSLPQSHDPCDQGNVRNCGDFGIGRDAQACYLRCIESAGGDVHELDRDNDGTTCECNY